MWVKDRTEDCFAGIAIVYEKSQLFICKFLVNTTPYEVYENVEQFVFVPSQRPC